MSVIDSVEDNIGVLDSDGNIIFVNKSWEKFAEMNGGKPSLMGAGINYLDVCRIGAQESEIAGQALRGIEQVLRGSIDRFVLEYPCDSKNEKRWFLLTATPLAGMKGYAVVSHANITERKIMEDKLKESEGKYSSLFHKNHSVILIIDQETGDIVDANAEACSFYGYGIEDIRKMKISSINVLPKEEIFTRMSKAVSSNCSVFQFPHRLSDGSIRDVEVYSGPIWIDGRKLLYSIVHDITERRKTEDALLESERRYRKLTELSPDAIIVCGRGEILFANNQAAKLLRVNSPDDLTGKLVAEFFYSKKGENQLEECIYSNEREIPLTEQKIITSDGTVIDVEVAAAPLRIYEKPSVQMVIRDITERKKELERAASIQAHRLSTTFPIESRAVLESIYMPARVVSGDFYQLYRINDYQVVGLLGDVRGKGVTAALNVTAMKVLFGDGVLVNDDPVEILKYLNRQVIKHLEEEYTAACCFRFDFKSMKAVVAGAGVNQFYYSRAGCGWEEKIVKGPFLGMFEDSVFEKQVLDFKSQDRFYFYTDGLDFIFEDPEMKDKCKKTETLKELKHCISDLLHNSKASDDSTWLGIEIK